MDRRPPPDGDAGGSTTEEEPEGALEQEKEELKSEAVETKKPQQRRLLVRTVGSRAGGERVVGQSRSRSRSPRGGDSEFVERYFLDPARDGEVVPPPGDLLQMPDRGVDTRPSGPFAGMDGPSRRCSVEDWRKVEQLLNLKDIMVIYKPPGLSMSFDDEGDGGTPYNRITKAIRNMFTYQTVNMSGNCSAGLTLRL